MEDKQKPNVTLDDLAVMVKDGFDSVDKRLEKLDVLEKDLNEVKVGQEDINRTYAFAPFSPPLMGGARGG